MADTIVVLKNDVTKITIGAEQGPPGIIVLTTNGNNGASTLTNSVLNIPTPTLAGLGGQTATDSNLLALTYALTT